MAFIVSSPPLRPSTHTAHRARRIRPSRTRVITHKCTLDGAQRTLAVSVQPSPAGAASPRAQRPHVIIVGGGAAGYLCAIAVSRRTSSLADTTLLEATEKPLSKVLISGGGRCNVTSSADLGSATDFGAHYPRGRRELIATLARFGARDAVALFEDELGVPLKVEAESNKVFPVSDRSSSVASALRSAARNHGVDVRLGARVAGVRTGANGEAGRTFHVEVDIEGERATLPSDFVVVCTGGSKPAWKWISASFGHAIIPPVPSLFTFAVRDDARLAGLAGLSVSDAEVQLLTSAPPSEAKRAKRTNRNARGKTRDQLMQRGALLITHWGLSGPAVLALSAFGARELADSSYRLRCSVNWLPRLSRTDVTSTLHDAKRCFPSRLVTSHNPFRDALPRRLWVSLLHHSPGVTADVERLTWNDCSKHYIEQHMVNFLIASVFQIHGKGQFKDEFVTCGGVDLKEMNMSSFESKLIPNVYFAGETLDVDGKTGGYNLQFAWSSGWISGNHIADQIEQAAIQDLDADKLESREINTSN